MILQPLKGKKLKFFYIKENLYLVPVFGIILGLFVLPFLNVKRWESHAISIYVIFSTIFVYANELIDCYKETKRYGKLPIEIRTELKLQNILPTLYYILLTFIFLPILLFAFCNYWTTYSLHWGIFGITIVSSLIFTFLDDIKEENEEICDGYYFWGDYL